MNLLRDALDFAKKAKNIGGVVSIILFGSVARGEAAEGSDIDIAVIYKKKSKDVEKKVDELRLASSEKIKLLHLTIDDLEAEKSLAAAIAGDGLLLHGRPVVFTAEKEGLKPHVLVTYSIKHLPQPEKMKVNRALNGGTSKSTYKGRVHVSKFPGMVKEAGMEKIADGVLLVPHEKAPKLTKLFKQLNVRWKEWSTWLL